MVYASQYNAVDVHGLPVTPGLTLRRFHERRDVPAHAIVSLGVSNSPYQHVVRTSHCPGRPRLGQLAQGAPDVLSGQVPQRDVPGQHRHGSEQVHM